MIEPALLETYGATLHHYPKGMLLFSEGEEAVYYYQIQTGAVKMVNFGDGKEFVQGIFGAGQGFAEPPMLLGKPYPASALTTQPTTLWRCHRTAFRQLLQDHFDLHWRLTEVLAERLVNKAFVLEQLAIEDAEQRLLNYIDHQKEQLPSTSQPYKVAYTRQQLADLLGLRVETVIRALKMLEQQGEISIQDGSVFR